MKFSISGLHPVTGNWVTLQEVHNDVVLTADEISEAIAEYADLIKDLTKKESSVGVQMNLSQPGRRLIFDPRKFLAVVVELEN